MKRKLKTLIGIGVIAAAVVGGVTTAAGAKSPPPHQTPKSIAASEAQAKARDAKAKVTAPTSTADDVAALQASAANTVAKANAGVQAAATSHDAGLWGDIATLYAATATLDAANTVANDLKPPPPPPATTTTTKPPVTTTTVAPTTTTSVVPTGLVHPLGVYNGSVSSALSLANALGLTPLQGYSYYCDGTSWSSISSCSAPGGLPSGTTLLVGLNLTPNGKVGDSQSAANLGTFQSVARNFKNYNGTVVFRLGWEMDGNWFSWGNGVNGNTPATFASATGTIIPAMKAIMPNAQFDFSDNMGSSTLAQLKSYIGGNAALWTYIGGDHYADKGSTGIGSMSNMTAAVTLSSLLGKPFSIGEFGLNGTDNPVWIAAMCQVIEHPAQASAANNWPSYTTGPTSYFNADESINSAITQFPKSEAAFKADC